MLTESKKMDKFLINVVPTFQPIHSDLDFNYQFALIPEENIQRYRLRCVFPNTSTGLLAASASIGAISSPVAPSLHTLPVMKTSMDSMTSISSSSTEPENKKNNNSPIASPATSVATLQRELREARIQIEQLKSSSSVSA